MSALPASANIRQDSPPIMPLAEARNSSSACSGDSQKTEKIKRGAYWDEFEHPSWYEI
jgi:hypothetical protein